MEPNEPFDRPDSYERGIKEGRLQGLKEAVEVLEDLPHGEWDGEEMAFHIRERIKILKDAK